MWSFVKTTWAFSLGLYLLVFSMSFFIKSYDSYLGLGAVTLMWFNACLAIGSWMWFPKANPQLVLTASMLVRMIGLSILFLVLFTTIKMERVQVSSFLLTCVVAFLVYQILEVRFLIKHQQPAHPKGSI